MHVRRLALHDFRNYQAAELDLSAAATVVCGPNGAGKTNLLEGLYFGLTGRSCRTTNERELVRSGARVARASVTTMDVDGEHLLEVGLEPGQPKRLRLDGADPQGASSRPRPLVSVFLPDRLELVKGAPGHRRAHLDRFVAAVWPARAGSRGAYGRALAQRNALLGRVRTGAASPEHLDAWDAELARCGAQLIADRAAAGELLAPRFRQRAGELGLPEEVQLRYRARSRAADAGELAGELAERRDDDLARGFTTHGPHRDELLLMHGGRSLRSFGSQGQQRVALLALLFAERDVLSERSLSALMLLDDVMSELDLERRDRLMGLVRDGGQAVITATEPEHVPGVGDADAELVTVVAGELRQSTGVVAG